MSTWIVCPRCHYSQMPAERCRRCGQDLSQSQPAPVPSAATEPPVPPTRRKAPWIAALLVAGLAAGVYWLARSDRPATTGAPEATPLPTAEALDLAGRWQGSVSKTVGGNPPRPALKEVSIESDRQGGILAARVVFTDPGRGGAGAGYRVASDGPARLAAAAAAVAAQPRGASLAFDFLELPGWVPARPRLWRAIEGSGPGVGPAQYLLVESLETDYLVQAGVNESGFLSYAFFSSAYAPARGADVLSSAIHPEPAASLRGFQNLVWDLSGAADFLKLQLPVTISGPEGGHPDRLTLTR